MIKQAPVKGRNAIKVSFVLPKTRSQARPRWSATSTAGTPSPTATALDGGATLSRSLVPAVGKVGPTAARGLGG